MTRWVGREKAYFVEERLFSTSELKLLIDAVQSADFITDKNTNELIEKIANLGGCHRADILKGKLED